MGIHKQHTNRLIHEASPYLLQHANNPVDWYPWCDEAFEAAKRQNKPIFLSVGYSTCHWCHVMAHESFENDRIAAVLNEHFISIKVDREELPGVDAVYMDFVQETTGSGGWPLSVFLTPEAKPFYGGTYFPPVDSYGRAGFETLLTSIRDAWQNQQEQIRQSSEQMVTALQNSVISGGELTITESDLKTAFQTIKNIFDVQYGGFGREPKFPQPSMLSFLLVYAHRTRNQEALQMTKTTLEKMANGGIYDHLGGGFHRYSVDREWLVPHFEKMLYDQALISRCYIQAFQITKDPAYRKVANEILNYVLRDMTSSQGGFFSAEDADSEGREGTFYVWTLRQIEEILSGEEQKLALAYYGITVEGNFEDETNILHISASLPKAAKKVGIDFEDAPAILETAKQKLFAARQKRTRPHRDDKIVAGWNGLMISSLAYGGTVFNELRCIAAAQRCADFVMSELCQNGRLNRYYAKDKAHGDAVLEDYAYMIRGFIDLYQADFDSKWLSYAVQLADQMLDLFEDKKSGGFYLTAGDAENLILRTRPHYDGATPSGNSVASTALIRLSELTGNRVYFDHAQKAIAVFNEDLKNRGPSLTELLSALDLWLGPRSEIVICGSVQSKQTQEMLNCIREHFLPRSTVMVRDSEMNAADLEQISESAKTYKAIDGKETVYLCEDFVCKSPITEYDDFVKAVNVLR